jgi:hypothetical protein
MLRLALPITLALACLAVPAGAVVPPKGCGTITVNSKRYQVKADQMSCQTGRDHARRYLARHVAPSGYRCRDRPSRKGRVDFYCNNGRKIFFAIRR